MTDTPKPTAAPALQGQIRAAGILRFVRYTDGAVSEALIDFPPGTPLQAIVVKLFRKGCNAGLQELVGRPVVVELDADGSGMALISAARLYEDR